MRDVFLVGIVEQNEESQRLLRRIFLDRGYDVEMVNSLAAAMERIQAVKAASRRPFDLIVADHSPPAFDGFGFLKAAHVLLPQAKLVLYTDYRIDECIHLALDQDVGNVIAKTSPPDAEELIYTADSLLRQQIRGLEGHLAPGTEIRISQVRRPAIDKHQVIDDVRGFLEALNGATEYLRDVVGLVLDEMIENAAYNAPQEKDGSKRYERGMDIVLSDAEVVTVAFGCDRRYFGFSVSDALGTLSREDILRNLDRALNRGPAVIAEHGGGGFFLMRRFIDRFIVNIERGKRTDCIGLIDLAADRSQAEIANKSIHVFQVGGFESEVGVA
ncbi:MAG: response regulator [Candidatus Schekmanbacteria bacterium]|nr:response regulator [Candidatus Schekmanbacteria bacterium]